MMEPNDKPRAPRLPRVEPVLAETREQAAYDREMQSFRAEVMGRSTSWRTFFRNLGGQIIRLWFSVVAVFALIVLVLVLSGSIPTR
jgi:hypothetical protein